MIVNRENFEYVLPLVEESIRSADYIAFDAEFSGIRTRLETEQSEFDSPEERYQKVKEIVQSYTGIQFGICPFKWDAKAKQYLARPFCFFTFPISQESVRDPCTKFQVSRLSKSPYLMFHRRVH